MKKYCLIISCFILLFFNIDLNAQNECGTDQLHERLMQTDTTYRSNYVETQQQIQAIIQSGEFQQRSINEIYTIPVVVHVIHIGEPIGTGSNIPDEQIYDAIDNLNQRWRNVIGNGVDMELRGCLKFS